MPIQREKAFQAALTAELLGELLARKLATVRSPVPYLLEAGRIRSAKRAFGYLSEKERRDEIQARVGEVTARIRCALERS